ncbi:Protein SERAC1 [Colletotrichum sidae]|uniref:Protein SERAC1 n=1 Tax=Colletotrichum sidae TaxID=1347389 RepID=A0A4R8TKG8_9PEZI|nr:Protein SERAC1 [Colletotrichum sidae]
MAEVKFGLFDVAPDSDSPDLDIVFVHGLQGHPFDTWTVKPAIQPHKKNEKDRNCFGRLFKGKRAEGKDAEHSATASDHTTPGSDQHPQQETGGDSTNSAASAPRPSGCFWPRDLLKKDFPTARILTYGYDSSVSHFFEGPANVSNIYDHARDLLQRLAGERVDCENRRLIFIAHSLGGLVVKAALRDSQLASETKKDLRNVHASTIAVLFFGTPHRGSEWVNAGKMAQNFAKAFGFSTTSMNLDLLNKSSPTLERIRDEFTELLDSSNLEITSYQEKKGYARTSFGGLDDLIVDPSSSAIDHKLERRYPINANHVDMCKFEFEGGTRKSYEQNVRNEIKRHLKRSVESNTAKTLMQLDVFADAMSAREKQIELAHHQTLSWLLGSDSTGPGLTSWLSNGDGIYWIQGLPGSGKSTAMQNLVRSKEVAKLLKKAKWSRASMFLADRMSEDQRSWTSVLAAMVYWLWKSFPELSSTMEPHVRHGPPRNDSWSRETLESILIDCKRQDRVEFSICFFVDALDEMDNNKTSREIMIGFMEKLVDQNDCGKGHVKICAASRPENEISIRLGRRKGFKMQDWTKPDISAFVRTQLRLHPDAQSTDRPESYDMRLKEICSAIIDGAQGVFLWVRLVVSDVWDSQTAGEALTSILKRIQKLPKKDLPEFYMHILRKSHQDTRRETQAVLAFLLASTESVSLLSIGVLFHIVSKHRGLQEQSSISEEELAEMNGRMIERKIRSRTGGLLQIVPAPQLALRKGRSRKKGREEADFLLQPSFHPENLDDCSAWNVQFFHQTVKEFLLSSELYPDLANVVPQWASDPQRAMRDGHSLILWLIEAHLGLSKSVKAESKWQLDVEQLLMRCAASNSHLLEDSDVDLLIRLDRAVSLMGFTWGMPEKWRNNFLAFAITKEMNLFVEKAVRILENPNAKPGKPLLHYTVGDFLSSTRLKVPWAREREVNEPAARALIEAGADINATFYYSNAEFAMSLLEIAVYDVDINHPAPSVAFINYCVEKGANLERPIPKHERKAGSSNQHLRSLYSARTKNTMENEESTMTTALHNIAAAIDPLSGDDEALSAILKRDLNRQRGDGKTVFDMFAHQHTQSPRFSVQNITTWLNHGAIMTPWLVHFLNRGFETYPHSTRHSALKQVLSEGCYAEAKYFDPEAWKLARQYWIDSPRSDCPEARGNPGQMNQ